MATARTTTRKKAAPRKPQDHLPKGGTAEVEAEYEGGPFEITVADETFTVKDPDDWSPMATEVLASGQWMLWAASALDGDPSLFAQALAETTSGGMKAERRRILRYSTIAAQQLGEGDSSPTS